jgi:CO/xanthine dehydrogenase Mo-binding subunit
VRKGDPLAILQQCDVVLDEKYSTVQQEHAYLETEGALAIPSDEGGILVYYSGQSPFINKGILAMVLGIDPEMVRVIQPHVGGSFGGKDDLNYYSSGQVAALALKTGRPVRMTFSREESMVASYKRDAMHMHIRLGARKDGTLQACKFEATLDSGAYASQSVFTAWRASIHAMGAYRYDACNVDVVGVYTNNGYAGAFRGFGNTEVCFGIEVAVDEMADKLGVDPLDFRLRNCLRQGDETPHGQVLTESIGLADCLEQVRIKGDWDRKRREYGHRDSAEFVHGIGVSALFHGISLGAEGLDAASSTIEVHPDYSISITSGLTDYGTGSRTVFALIAAEELGVQPERVHYMLTDTDSAIDSGPTVASRSTILGGNAMRIAARKLASTLDQSAADLLGCEVAQLGREGESYFGPSEQLIDWKLVVDHARNMGLVLSAHGKWTSPAIHWDRNTGRGTPYFAYHFGAQVAEVEVDQRTGKVEITGYWAVHDLGKLLFPQGAFGQLYGAITQGIGYALLEEASFRNGYLQSTNFDTYLIPTSMDVPDIDGDFVEATLKAGPYGAKNIAEPAMPPAAPAIINAIAHATGKRIRSLPANLERVLLGYELHPNASMEPCKIGLRIR